MAFRETLLGATVLERRPTPTPTLDGIMITTLPPQSARPAKPETPSGLGHKSNATAASDFRLLGLRPREARVEVIREAVHNAATQVQLDGLARGLENDQPESNEAQDDSQRLAQIAIAGYRLLDPRRRRTLFERVQLLMWTEEELDTTIKSLWAGKPRSASKVRIAINTQPRAVQSADTQPENEERVALEVFRSMRTRDRQALALWIGLASLTLSLTATLPCLHGWLGKSVVQIRGI